MRNNNIFGHTAWGADTSGGDWQLAGGDQVHVDNYPRRERMWVAGEIEQ